MTSDQPVLAVRDLRVEFHGMRGLVKVLEGVDFVVNEAEILGLVGESGCGKTVTGLAVMRLLPQRLARVTSGHVLYRGEDLLAKSEGEMRALRGRELAMVFQDPLASLNPVFTVEQQVGSMVRMHDRGLSRREVTSHAREALESVGLRATDSLMDSYPHRLSGGMRQRVCLAMALSSGAPLLIGDEPTTALDVTIQAQILSLLARLRSERSLSMILVTHNLGVAAQMCDRIAVMYAGSIVEQGNVTHVLKRSRHPYTVALRECLPQGRKGRELQTIPGSVPDLIDPPLGCRFHPRCQHAMPVCEHTRPETVVVDPGHEVACHWVAGASDPEEESSCHS